MQDPALWEFVKVCTVGPPHLRLCPDIVRLIIEFAMRTDLLHCQSCDTLLLSLQNSVMLQHETYFHVAEQLVCYQCSKFHNLKRNLTVDEIKELYHSQHI